MARLLYVEASPRKDRSAAIEISRAFLKAYRAVNPVRLIGITDIIDIIVEKTLFGAEIDRESRMKAKQTATALANRF
jgi:FMN-dependent NADH-azoreductase